MAIVYAAADHRRGIGVAPRASAGTVETDHDRVAVLDVLVPVVTGQPLIGTDPRVISRRWLVQVETARVSGMRATVVDFGDKTVEVNPGCVGVQLLEPGPEFLLIAQVDAMPYRLPPQHTVTAGRTGRDRIGVGGGLLGDRVRARRPHIVISTDRPPVFARLRRIVAARRCPPFDWFHKCDSSRMTAVYLGPSFDAALAVAGDSIRAGYEPE